MIAETHLYLYDEQLYDLAFELRTNKVLTLIISNFQPHTHQINYGSPYKKCYNSFDELQKLRSPSVYMSKLPKEESTTSTTEVNIIEDV